MRVLIIGNGAAGMTAAQELRTREPSMEALEIKVLARERYHYYSRPRLPEAFEKGLSPEELALHKPGWYEERGIEVLLGREAVALRRDERRILVSDGEEMAYDVLVLALGAEAARPKVQGLSLPEVCAVREYDDAARLRSLALARPGAAVVVGGGLLGLEAARHLQLLGPGPVSVLEVAPRLLPRQLDQRGATLLESRLSSMGIRIVTGASLAAFEGRDRLEGLSYTSPRGEESAEASLAVVSMGVRPRIGLAKAAGLAVAKGIIVDSFLRTSDPSIYAAGDCAEFSASTPGILPAALEQGAVCAAAILGGCSRPYAGTPPSATLKVAGIDLFSAGAVEKTEDMEELAYEPGEGRYERYLIREGILAGAIVIGSRERARSAKAKMGSLVAEADLDPLAGS